MRKYFKSLLVLMTLLVMSASIMYAATEWDVFTYKDPNITYDGGGWYEGSHPSPPEKYLKVSLKTGAEYRFNFTGDRIMIYSPLEYDKTSKLILDGTTEITPILKRGEFSAAYEITGLENREHSIRVVNGTGASMNAISPTKVYLSKGGKLLPYNEKAIPQKILTFETLEAEQTLNQAFDLKMYMQNITEIAAEDILIKYDPTFLEFNGFKENSAIKVVYSNAANGEIRVVLASMGKDHIINAKTLLSDINFRPIKVGETTVQYTNAKVTDGMTYEKDLLSESLGDILIKIKAPLLLDVNKNGKYTLIDLGIIARNLWATLPNETYNLDQLVDEKVDDLDLIEVFKKVLVNPEYKFGN